MDIAVQDVFHYPGLEDVRISSGHFGPLFELWDRVLLAQIFPQKERVDFGRIAPHDDVLVRERKNLGLEKAARAQEITDSAGLPHVVQSVLE